jgi:hypothetical protein
MRGEHDGLHAQTAFRVRDAALRVPPWALLLTAIASASAAVAGDTTGWKIASAALAVAAAVVGYLHNEAGPYPVGTDDYAHIHVSGVDPSPLYGTNEVAVLVPERWHRHRAASFYQHAEGGGYELVMMDFQERPDGRLMMRAGSRPDAQPPTGEIRFGG